MKPKNIKNTSIETATFTLLELMKKAGERGDVETAIIIHNTLYDALVPGHQVEGGNVVGNGGKERETRR
jgi:hypothetical protein